MSERTTRILCTILMIPVLCMILSVLLPEKAAAEAVDNVQEYDKHARCEETREPSGYPDELSAMPCCMTSNTSNALEALKEKNEQETSEESKEKSKSNIRKELRVDDMYLGPEDWGDDSIREESYVQGGNEGIIRSDLGFHVYRINGEIPDPELQRMIWDALDAAGISYWYEGCLAQCFQESHMQRYAQNPNGLDKGILQYRITYWDWSKGDIFDVDAQLQRYAAEMAARFNAGLSVDEAISRHKTSDYCTQVDWLYVQHVKQWLAVMEEVE